MNETKPEYVDQIQTFNAFNSRTVVIKTEYKEQNILSFFLHMQTCNSRPC